MTALTPAPHELAHLAHITTAGRLDETLLVRVLIGAGEAGMPWPRLLAIVHQLIQTADGDRRPGRPRCRRARSRDRTGPAP